jgi:peptidoglycan/xylan/chitin deacetylase (PgdA/CDA1 family)
MVRLTASLVIITSFMSCQPNGINIQTNIESSIEANSTAVTHSDWETSEFHPKFLFDRIQKQFDEAETDEKRLKIKNELCSALKNLSDDTLLIFENEIMRTENNHLISFCSSFLRQRINDKNSLNRMDIEYSTDAYSDRPSNINFILKTKVISSSDYLNFNKYDASLQKKEIILTFDDGPQDSFTNSVLKTLKEVGNAKAMFFELGKQIQKYPRLTQNTHSDGHIVANHSWEHLCLNDTNTCRKNNKGRMLTDTEVETDIMDTFRLIQKTIGKVAPFFRFPYGDNRTATSKYLKEYGVLEMKWNIDSNDWRYSQKVGSENIPFTSKEVLTSALRTLDQVEKGVVLFHDVHRRTAEILPQFLYELYKRNYTLVILNPNSNQTK